MVSKNVGKLQYEVPEELQNHTNNGAPDSLFKCNDVTSYSSLPMCPRFELRFISNLQDFQAPRKAKLTRSGIVASSNVTAHLALCRMELRMSATYFI